MSRKSRTLATTAHIARAADLGPMHTSYYKLLTLALILPLSSNFIIQAAKLSNQASFPYF